MWRVADIQGHRDPFSERMLACTIPQLDFILECYAKDHPKEYTFTRIGLEAPAEPQAAANWFDVLRGKARDQFMYSRLNHAVIRARKAKQAVFGLRGKGKI